MSNCQRIKEYIEQRIAQIDSEYGSEADPMKKLNLTTIRTSFSNILNTYLNQDTQLGASYFKHALTYYQSQCYEQTLYYAQLAARHSKEQKLLEDTLVLTLRSLLRLGRVEEADDHLRQGFKQSTGITAEQKSKEFYEVKAQIQQKMQREEEAMRTMAQLESLIEQRHGVRSTEMGLHYISKGRTKAAFGHNQEALLLMQKGMNLLIEVKYRDQLSISQIYVEMAALNRSLDDLDSQYSSLICGHSMMRQVGGMEKDLVQLMHKIAGNLWQREDFESCLKELTKIEVIEKHIYGQSSLVVGKTVKWICQTLGRLNRRGEAKKYEQQYNRIVGCNDRKGLARQKPLKYSQSKKQH